MIDYTQGWSWAHTLSYSSTLASAEWIEEAQQTSLPFVLPLVPLANFSSVNFYGADYGGLTSSGSFAPAPPTEPSALNQVELTDSINSTSAK